MVRNVGAVFPSYRALLFPVTSKNRKVLSVLASTAGKGCQALPTRNPLVRLIRKQCNVSNSKRATLVRVTTIDNLPLIPRSGEGPVLAAACKAKRLVLSTLRRNYHRFVINVNNDTAGSTKLNVLRTLKFHFLSGQKGLLKAKNEVVSRMTSVSASTMRPTLGRTHFAVTYSMHGPFYKSSKTTCIFTSRGKTSTGVIGRLSANVRTLSQIVLSAANGSVSSVPKTKTTKKVNKNFLTFLGTRLGPNVHLVLSILSFNGEVAKTSLVFANRKQTSQRAIVKGIPSNVLRRTQGRGVPIVMLTKDVRSTTRVGQTNFRKVFSVAPNPIAVRGTVRPRFTERGVHELIARVYSMVRPFTAHWGGGGVCARCRPYKLLSTCVSGC